MDPRPAPIRPMLGTIALVLWGLVPLGMLSGRAARLNEAIRDDGPNAADYERIERGYYERLIEPRPPRARPGANAPFDAGALAINVADVREYVLKPDLVTLHKGARWTTNGRGMRDGPYAESKPAGTIRVGLVGDSIAAGWGVDDGLGFEPLLETAWDDRARGRARVEVLNFAVPGHAPGQRWEHFSQNGWATDPDLVIFEGTLADLGWDERRLRALLPRGLGPEAPAYRASLAEAGITSTTTDLKARLRPHREAILAGVYRRVVEDCHDRGVPVAWLLLPRVGKPGEPADRARLIGLAGAGGFDRVVDISDAFDGRPASSLAIAADDFHPNAAGHAELSRRIDAALGDFVSSLSAPSRPQGRGSGRTPGRPDRAPGALPQPAGVDPR